MCILPEYFGPPILLRPESSLYPRLAQFLYLGFHEAHKPRHGSLYLEVGHTHDVAAPSGGTWTRPDLAAVGISRGRFAATVEVRLFSFEVKTADGCRLQSVHEALAHTRFVNYSYLVWNRPACICDDEENYQAILSNCAAYGVGLITIHNPNDLNTFQIRLCARRKKVAADLIDEFILTRFSPAEQARIDGAMQRYCVGSQ